MDAPTTDSLRSRIEAALFRPVDLASRVAFRIAFAAILLWECGRYSRYGWIDQYWIEPAFHFTYYGFEWVEPWAGAGMHLHFAVLAAAALLVLLGLRYRLAATLVFLTFTHAFLLDQARYLNHFYLICLIAFLMIFVPAHRLLSLDARLRPRLRSTTAPAWSLWLLRFQIGIVYFFGGVAKLNADWLSAAPVERWLATRADAPLIGALLVHPSAGWVVAYGGLLIDLLVVPLLLWRRTRLPAFGVIVIFNVTNALMFNIGIFPWMMIAASTLFFEPDWPRRLLARLKRIDACEPSPAPAAAASGNQAVRGRALVLAGLGAWAALQVLVPLRHTLYPGNVQWTEEGHRFAWRMKLRDKQAQCWFQIVDPRGGAPQDVYPDDLLARWQSSKMCTRPDMILQFAHWIAAREYDERGHRVQVHAQAFASLHGRPFQLLIDPAVDLAATPRDLRPAAWIVPLVPDGPNRE